MRVLSIQSSVAAGAVGNSAAVFCLQRLGVETIRIDTVRFSNHPGHGGFTGGPAEVAELSALVEGLDARGLLAGVRCVLSGYLGAGAHGSVVSDALARARRASPNCLYALDPVMGDRGRVFVRPEVVDAIRALAPSADILFPNTFELGLLTGLPAGSLAEVRAAARALRGAGREDRIVVVTSVVDGRALGTLAASRDGDFIVRVVPVDHPAYGAGDSFAALFLGRFLSTHDLPRALSQATSAVRAVVAATAAAGSIDLALVANQAALVDPPAVAAAERLAD
ncbi:MAG: pyridoxal kinase [Alphaproteobacteria bacterium]|nr:pyridoxal kinase [Alphaproteobacteria bacterium]